MTTPPAKAVSFFRSRLPQQRLLRLRLAYTAPTLAPDGSIQADWSLVDKAFQVLRGELLAAAQKPEVVKEQRTAPCRAKVNTSMPQKGVRRNSTVAFRQQWNCANHMAWTSPITWTPGQVVTSTDLNAQLRDNLGYLLARPNGGVLRDNNANYTTSSGMFVDIDGTNLKITLTCTATKVLLGFTGVMNASGGTGYLDFMVDSARVGSAGDGLLQVTSATDQGYTMVALATVTPGTRVFKVQWGITAGTFTLRSGNGNSLQNYIPSFYALEVA